MKTKRICRVPVGAIFTFSNASLQSDRPVPNQTFTSPTVCFLQLNSLGRVELTGTSDAEAVIREDKLWLRTP